MGVDDSSDSTRREIERAFPELDEISEGDLREKVLNVWVEVIAESEYDTLSNLFVASGLPHLEDETVVQHTRTVTRCALALADTLVEIRGLTIDRDTLVAGALVHDVSKLLETVPDGNEPTELGKLIPHPHYSIHLLAAEKLPIPVQHIALAHTSQSAPRPQTLEAQLVVLADVVAVEAVTCGESGNPFFDIETSPR